MNTKGFAENGINVETPNDIDNSNKPLKSNQTATNRVDINVLKSKLQETEDKEFKKNLYILSTLIFCLGILGIYLSFWKDLQIVKLHVLIELWKTQVLT